MSKFIPALLEHPAAILFVSSVVCLFLLKFLGLSYQDFILTTNTVDVQNRAIMVLVVGFWMLIDCKTYGIDTTVAGGVIGCGINMLTGQKQPPPNSTLIETSSIQTDPNAPK